MLRVFVYLVCLMTMLLAPAAFLKTDDARIVQPTEQVETHQVSAERLSHGKEGEPASRLSGIL